MQVLQIFYFYILSKQNYVSGLKTSGFRGRTFLDFRDSGGSCQVAFCNKKTEK